MGEVEGMTSEVVAMSSSTVASKTLVVAVEMSSSMVEDKTLVVVGMSNNKVGVVISLEEVESDNSMAVVEI